MNDPRHHLAFSGELWGALDPCGCSGGVAGGFARRAVSLARRPGCVRCELGDLAASDGPLDDLRFDAVVDLLNALDYQIICPGEGECAGDRLQRLSRQFRGALVCANLQAQGVPLRAAHVWQAGAQRIVLVSALSPSLVKTASAQVRVTPWQEPLRLAARTLKTADRVVLAFHGPLAEAVAAVGCIPQASLIVCAHEGQVPKVLRQERSRVYAAAGSDGAGLGYADLLPPRPEVSVDRLLQKDQPAQAFMNRMELWKRRIDTLRKRVNTTDG